MLIGNRSAFHKLPIRFLAGSTTTSHSQLRSGFGQAGMRRNRFYQDGATTALKTYSYPQGTYAPSGSQNVGSAYILPQQSGSMASFNAATLVISPAGNVAGGITTTGTASFVIDFATAAGQLISSGAGSASFAFTAAGNIQAVLNAVGSASFAITTNTPQLLALGWVQGTAGMAYSASLTAYARGNMIGSTVDNTTLTADVIAAQVWNSLAVSYTTAGTMGNKLNSAASGGVDYTTMAEAVRTELQAELLRIVELAKVHGLVIGTDLVVTATSRTAGDVVQSIEATGSKTTVSRT